MFENILKLEDGSYSGITYSNVRMTLFKFENELIIWNQGQKIKVPLSKLDSEKDLLNSIKEII